MCSKVVLKFYNRNAAYKALMAAVEEFETSGKPRIVIEGELDVTIEQKKGETIAAGTKVVGFKK